MTPSVGILKTSGQAGNSMTPLYGIKASLDFSGHDISDCLGLETTLNYFQTSGRPGGEGYLARMDAIYPFAPHSKTVPFIALGLGGIKTESTQASSLSPLVNYGLGIKHFWENYLALRVDVRQLMAYKSIGTHNNFELSVGLSYLFGMERRKPTPPLPKPVTAPAIPQIQPEALVPPSLAPEEAYVTMEKLGVVGAALGGLSFLPTPFPPEPVPQPQAGVLALSNPDASLPASGEALPQTGAGIPSSQSVPSRAAAARLAAPQQAASQPTLPQPAAPQPASPQPASPQPAVPEPAAPEPAVPRPAVPQAEAPRKMAPAQEASQPGRPRAAVREKRAYRFTVGFDFAKTEVNPKYDGQLKRAAVLITSATNPVVRIEGHTDNVGNARCNRVLSLKRANAVRDKLIKFGVDAGNIHTFGYGFQRPVMSNLSAKGRQKNRRGVTIITIVTEGATEASSPSRE